MKRILCFILFLILLLVPVLGMAEADVIASGDKSDTVALVQQRLRDLGYLNYRPTGKFSDMTQAAVQRFQQQNGIAADGQIGTETYNALFADTAIRVGSNTKIKKVSGPAFNGKMQTHGVLGSWETIQGSIPAGTSISVTDYNTGNNFTMIRTGGVNCAQVAPATAQDYQTYLAAFGGEGTWEHRAVLVTIGSDVYAASLFGMPTGGDDISGSGMKGYTTLYFNNSRTDLFSLADEEHILAISKAAGE